MTLLAPNRLWLLAVVGALAVAYAWLQQRRRHRAVRFTNVPLLLSVAPRRPGWRRHLPALAIALAMGATVVGTARPVREIRVPKESATVVLVIDTSASMQATDVEPTRLDAAVDAADAFVADLPRQLRVGLVSFDRFARIVATPTTDHESVRESLRALVTGPGTAAGEAVYAALEAIGAAEAAAGVDATGGDGAGASAVVLLSDGVTTVGRSVVGAAQVAAQRGVPVSTIAFGTDRGTVEVMGQLIPVPADPVTMAEVAELTAGRFFEAVSGDELRSVYDDIGTRVGYDVEQRDVTAAVLGVGAVALAAGLALAMAWGGRLV